MFGLTQEGLLGEFFVKNGEPHDRERCKDGVVALVDEGLVESLPAEGRSEAEPILRHHEQDVLVEHVDGQSGVSAVSLASMVEK